ncbi:chemotaxis signal transduction protein [Richelia sinica FACHB-800]|uniref:Chemotaxis protein CheW n=1 Tax=Richelia sinica FACHB-800 TaxID=1357546 RepID=A0A975T3L9_9NOST|nr:chemotaxis protein CheW [Richelia sinica]MBD2667134.1 chemotaxis protein CheW [Richelia sinica FACHB-800]QXE21558.1 chemotaxis signal transduction protein [Richelia sinica FACHB-800]
MNSINNRATVDNCWNMIGIAGDRSCPELSNFIHCRNCPVYSTAGRNLLERSLPENYQQEWTQLFAEKRTNLQETRVAQKSEEFIDSTHALTSNETIAVVIFRLQREWLALPAEVFKETISPSLIHTIPHRTNKILRGLVNIRGELQLCISLSNLLHLENADIQPEALSPLVYSRMVVVVKEGNAWVFAVDELYGIQRFPRQELRDTPNGTTSAAQTYTKGFFHWRSRSLSYLDDELLFTSLNRKVLP